eukprot:jgi/Botrbrau1/18598/Bobra.0367s0040.1
MELPGSPSKDGDVLRNVGCNVAHGGTNMEADLALAKLLQQQENAFASLPGSFPQHYGEENIRPSEGQMAVPMDVDDGDLPEDYLHDGEDLEEQWPLPLSPEERRRLQFQQERLLARFRDGEYNTEDDDDFEDDDIDPDALSYEDLLDVTDCVGSVKVGMRLDEIDALPRLKYGHARQICKSRHRLQSSSPVQGVDQCVVCLEEYAESDVTVVRLPCSHLYHPECIEQWLKLRKTCPLCLVEVEIAGKTG